MHPHFISMHAYFSKQKKLILSFVHNLHLISRHPYWTRSNPQRIMNLLGKSHVALREDVDSMKNKIYQLVESMIALAKRERENNIQRPAVIENFIPSQVNVPAQPHPIRISVENPVIQEHPNVQEWHTSPHDAIEYHGFAFPTPNPQRESPMVNIE